MDGALSWRGLFCEAASGRSSRSSIIIAEGSHRCCYARSSFSAGDTPKAHSKGAYEGTKKAGFPRSLSLARKLPTGPFDIQAYTFQFVCDPLADFVDKSIALPEETHTRIREENGDPSPLNCPELLACGCCTICGGDPIEQHSISGRR
jgi:hypothetical protein